MAKFAAGAVFGAVAIVLVGLIDEFVMSPDDWSCGCNRKERH